MLDAFLEGEGQHARRFLGRGLDRCPHVVKPQPEDGFRLTNREIRSARRISSTEDDNESDRGDELAVFRPTGPIAVDADLTELVCGQIRR